MPHKIIFKIVWAAIFAPPISHSIASNLEIKATEEMDKLKISFIHENTVRLAFMMTKQDMARLEQAIHIMLNTEIITDENTEIITEGN